MNKKIWLIIILIMIAITSVVGATYAIYTWAFPSVDIDGSFECFEIKYVKGQDIGSENEYRVLMPSDDYTEGLFASVIVGVDSKCTITGTGTLYLNTDTSTSSILLTSGALKYQVIENSYNKIASGTISNTGKIPIYENFNVTTRLKQYTVSVWLDGNMINEDNLNDILTSSYIGNISMRAESGDK